MSRDLNDLRPAVARAARNVLDSCRKRRLDLLIYCTRRTFHEQARLWRVGRDLATIKAMAERLESDCGRTDLGVILLDVGPQYGSRIVTNAPPGFSFHNYGLAFDAVPLWNGKPLWIDDNGNGVDEWDVYGEIVRNAGLDWAGNWKTFKEFPHAQALGFTIGELLAGG